MNIRRIWIPILFVLCWCWPGPHLVPTLNAKTFICEAAIIMLVFLGWTNTGIAAPRN